MTPVSAFDIEKNTQDVQEVYLQQDENISNNTVL